MKSLVLSKHLLWKDFRQLLPAIFGCWAILAVILVLICLRQLLSNDYFFMQNALMLVLSAPTLAALAASGIGIGHERQTRSWNWSSSLPIPWFSSWVSKSIMWFLFSGAMVVTLYGLYFVLMLACRSIPGAHQQPPDWITVQTITLTAIVVPLVVYCCFSIAALLWNDTLTAFVVAGISVAVLYVFLVDLLPAMLLGLSSTGPRTPAADALGIVLIFAFLVLVAGICMLRAYRWRWTTGQLASIGWVRRLPNPVTSLQSRMIWRSAAWSGGAGSEFSMLFMHGVVSAMGARIMIFLSIIGLMFLMRSPQGALLISAIGAGLMGVTVFSGDQTQAAYKFLADRGVSWRRLLVAHALPPLMLAFIPVVISLLMLPHNPASTIFFIAIAVTIFTVGMFCSLCSRLTLLSICMTIGSVVIAIFAFLALDQFWHAFSFAPPPAIAPFLTVAEFCVVATATVLLLRRWLVFDRVSGAAYFVSTCFLAIVPAHLLVVCFCFLAIPNVPWQGIPAAQIQTTSKLPHVDVKQLPIHMQRALYSTDPARLSEAVEFGFSTLESNYLGAVPSTVPIAVSLKELEADLDRIPPESKVTADPRVLSGEIENTAWLGLYATERLRDKELARRAWKVNRQLLMLVDYDVANSWQAVDSRITADVLRSRLTSDDWKFLAEEGSLAELQPEPLSQEVWTRQIRMFYSKLEANIHANWTSKFPPVRWYQQRLMAYRLEQQIKLISGEPVAYNPNVPGIYPIADPVATVIRIEKNLPR